MLTVILPRVALGMRVVWEVASQYFSYGLLAANLRQ